MKVKIQEYSNTVIPRYTYTGNTSIFTLKIADKFKYVVLPVKAIPPVYNKFNFLLFYDGVTSSSPYEVTAGRLSSPQYEATGARFMPYLTLADSYYLDPTHTAGWTAGSPYYYITSKEIPFLVESLVRQGLTVSSEQYVYINWHEDDRDFILYDGYTGPANGVSAAQHALLSKTMAKIITGGTGIDGISFYGLNHYFPNIKWGFYNQPKWPYYFKADVNNSNIWYKQQDGGITAIMEHAADVFLSATELVDAIGMLMPSVYSSINSRDFNKTHSAQATNLCNIINQKLIQQGKQPKKIIPFLSPIYLTDHTGLPYTVYNYMPAFVNFQYIPPATIMLDGDIRYEQVEPIIANGADGGTIWISSSYRTLQVAGRGITGMDEDIPLGAESWKRGPTAGITNPWSYKAVSRQAIAAHEAYTRGVCMGITGNRWWWSKEVPGFTAYVPPEWLPLGSNHAYPEAGATSGITATRLIESILENTKLRTINVFKDVWSIYHNG